MKTKKGTVVTLDKIEVGKVIEFRDMQMSASNSAGDIYMANFEFENDDGKSRYANYAVTPGCWRVTPRDGLIEWSLADELYFETSTSSGILAHMRAFMNKKEVYARFGLPPKRGILLGGAPGCGKSSAIRYFARSVLKEDPKVCILRVDSDQVDIEILTQMMQNSDPTNVSVIVLILEDVGGTNLDERSDSSDAQLLNFLDGSSIFKSPILILATTNFLDRLGMVLTDRPGRFDCVLETALPTDSEIFQIIEAVAKRSLTEKEKVALSGQGFTPAYAIEAIVRQELYDIEISEAVKQLVDQHGKSKEREHQAENKKNRVGFLGGY